MTIPSEDTTPAEDTTPSSEETLPPVTIPAEDTTPSSEETLPPVTIPAEDTVPIADTTPSSQEETLPPVTIPSEDTTPVEDTTSSENNEDTTPAAIIYDEDKTAVTLETAEALEHIEPTVVDIDASNITEDVKIVGNANDNVITSGAGDNVLTGGGGNNTFVLTTGNDIITDYKPKHDEIELSEAVITSSSIRGNDVILTTSEGIITLKNARNKKITITDSTGHTTTRTYKNEDNSVIPSSSGKNVTLGSLFSGTLDSSTYGANTKKINASKVTNSIEIVGNGNNNSIKSGSGDDTIKSGSGKNTLTGGKGADTFVMSAGSNNIITDYQPEDKIQIESGKVLKKAYNGDNVILTTTEGKITVKGGKDKELTIVDSEGNTNFYGSQSNDVFTYTGGNAIITAYNAQNDEIALNTASLTGSSIKNKDVILTTDQGTITIKNGRGKKITFIDSEGKISKQKYPILPKGLLYNTDYDKVFAINRTCETSVIDLKEYLPSVSKLNVSRLTADVEIIGNGSNNSITAGSGNDTIISGRGNNTLTGGEGADVFVCGRGNDIITDYRAGEDSIQLANGSITQVSVKGSAVILTTSNDSTIKINDGKYKNLTITDGEGNTTTRKYTRTTTLAKAYIENNSDEYWFTEDNNCNVTDFAINNDDQVNSIVQSDNLYSLDEISDFNVASSVIVKDKFCQLSSNTSKISKL